MTDALEALVGRVAALDRRCAQLSDNGTLALYRRCVGEEAVLAATASAAAPQDWLFVGEKLNVAALHRGVPVPVLLRAVDDPTAAAAVAAVKVVACTQGPATRLSHAAGLAWAARKDGVVAWADLGDGAISDGDVHCGLNFAAVLGAPVVFVVRAESPIAPRAEGWGAHALTVDGRDARATLAALKEARAHAAAGHGPVLVEARVDRSRTSANAAWIAAHEDALANEAPLT